ncbi:hypothetical protein SBA4_930031 [Candidatus Sulfopaludibacter sp. SbA4]|nr:hypothetical protein SBA4_930031 [Candidatus Sulfopaludibacter sp. SbA4]
MSEDRLANFRERIDEQRRQLEEILRTIESLLPKIPELNRLAEMRDRYASERLDPIKGEKERDIAQREWQRLNSEIEALWRDFQATEPAVWAFAARLKQTLASIPLEEPLVALRSEIEKLGFPSSVFPGARLLWQKSAQDLEILRERLAEIADLVGEASSESAVVPAERVGHSPAPTGGYSELLAALKERIRTARIKASVSVNRELILLYWEIGADILKRQQAEGWGAKVIDELARDLRRDFPDMIGLSARNLKYMRALAEAWPDGAIVQGALAQIPWSHNIALLEKLKAADERLWYARQAFQQGWSRDVLVHQIESGLYVRQGKALTNFDRTLPLPQSDLARQVIKDPYNFDFLALGAEMQERDLEEGLLQNLRDLILELGKGFAFVGNQYPLEVGNRDYRLDLLFYHLGLRCFVVFDLKIGEFKPEFAGKMNFYLSAVDDQLRQPTDQPTIGIILCRERNEITVEYALRKTSQPIGVSQYQLPEALKLSLPTQEELQSLVDSSQRGTEFYKRGPLRFSVPGLRRTARVQSAHSPIRARRRNV